MIEGYGAGRRTFRPVQSVAKALSVLLAALVCVATIGSFFGPWSWQLELLTHFRPQLAVVSLSVLVMALLVSSRFAMALGHIAILINVAPLVPYLSPGLRAAESDGADERAHLRVLTFNMHGQSTDQDAFRRMVERENPDVILLAEAPHDTSHPLHGWEDRYPHRISEDRGVPLDVILLSRWKLMNWSADRSAAQFRSVLTARLCHPDPVDRCFTLVGLHAAQPFGEDLARQRTQLDIAEREAKAASSGAVVLMGDLNLTPWSSAFQSLIHSAGLYDTARERKFTATWTSRFPLFGLPIDHILINQGLRANGSRVGEGLGSDHFPVLADLTLVANP